MTMTAVSDLLGPFQYKTASTADSLILKLDVLTFKCTIGGAFVSLYAATSPLLYLFSASKAFLNDQRSEDDLSHVRYFWPVRVRVPDEKTTRNLN